MFKLSEIKELIKLVDQTTIQELEIENEGARLFIRKPNKTESVIVNSLPSQSSYVSAIQQPPVQQAHLQPQANHEPAVVSPNKETDDANLHKIVSPMVGTFYGSPSPGTPAFTQKGDKVKEKTVVCIVEAMKLMNEIEAEVKGEIIEVLVENGQLVEYGQPLFLVKPE